MAKTTRTRKGMMTRSLSEPVSTTPKCMEVVTMGMRSYARFEEVVDRAGHLASAAPGDLPRIADMRVPMRPNHAKSTVR